MISMLSTIRHSSSIVRCSKLLRVSFPSAIIIPDAQHAHSKVQFSTKIFDHTPKSWHPYIRLSRLDKPTGSWVIFFPGAWSIAFASLNLPNLTLIGLFALGTILMRGAGCTINDIWDRNFDRLVERTKTRPLANGDLTVQQAVLWATVQLSASFLILIQLNWQTIIIGSLSVIPVAIYPIMKRYTYWPQIALGLTLNWGALMGFTAATNLIVPSLLVPLYLASIAWTLHYDTIYAHQDKHDDIRIGVKSTALRLGNQSKLWLRAFSIGMITNLINAGLSVDQSWAYYLGLTAAAYHLHRQIENVDLNDQKSCWKTFVSNRLTGALILASIIIGNYFK